MPRASRPYCRRRCWLRSCRCPSLRASLCGRYESRRSCAPCGRRCRHTPPPPPPPPCHACRRRRPLPRATPSRAYAAPPTATRTRTRGTT
eukprot:5883172-Prymnesium_polylepis.1